MGHRACTENGVRGLKWWPRVRRAWNENSVGTHRKVAEAGGAPDQQLVMEGPTPQCAERGLDVEMRSRWLMELRTREPEITVMGSEEFGGLGGPSAEPMGPASSRCSVEAYPVNAHKWAGRQPTQEEG